MGAWIEITLSTLKLLAPTVASFMGAWIEITTLESNTVELRSHPLWVRGLKFSAPLRLSCLILSHPLWVRGLK